MPGYDQAEDRMHAVAVRTVKAALKWSAVADVLTAELRHVLDKHGD